MPKLWRSITSRYATTVGDGTTTAFTLHHGLGQQDVLVMVRPVGAGTYLPMGAGAGGWTLAAPDADNVTVTFGTAPTANQYRVIVVG